MTEGYFKDIYLEDGKAHWISNIKGVLCYCYVLA